MPKHLLFGNEQSESVKAEIRGRSYPNSEDPVDGNWLTVWLSIAISPFSGSYEALWRAEAFPRFRQELQSLYTTLEGDVKFAPDWEHSLAVEFHGDGLGHLSVKGQACANPVSGPWFRFELPTIDQTYIPAMVSAIQELESDFPVM